MGAGLMGDPKSSSPFKKFPLGVTGGSDDDISRAVIGEDDKDEFESVILSNEEAPSSYDGGMTSEYSQITKDIDKEMRVLIKDYEECKAKKDNKTDLMLKRIRLKHPIF